MGQQSYLLGLIGDGVRHSLTPPMHGQKGAALSLRLVNRPIELTLDLHQPFRDLEGVTEDLFVNNLARLEAKFQLMQELDMDLILVPSNAGTATIDDDDEVVADQLRRAAKLASRYNMWIAYEALAWGTFVNTYWHSWQLVHEANHPIWGSAWIHFISSPGAMIRRGSPTSPETKSFLCSRPMPQIWAWICCRGRTTACSPEKAVSTPWGSWPTSRQPATLGHCH